VCGPVAGLLPAVLFKSGRRPTRRGYSGYTFIYSLQLARSAFHVGFSRVSATSSLVSASRAGGFDEARGFAILLAGIRIFDELKQRRSGHHP